MKRAKTAAVVAERQIPSKRTLRAVPAPRPQSFPLLGTARIHSITDEGVVLDLAGDLTVATLDPAVHPAVVAGAHRRGERVLIERGEDGSPVVLGALRTQPTPGVDAADAYCIEAERISLRANEEISLSTQTAAVVLRAIGEVETYAERILSRAEGVHKIIGRMLRLN